MNDDRPKDGDLLKDGNLQGMVIVPRLLIVPEMGES